MRWLLALAIVLASMSGAKATPLTSTDIRELLSVSGVNPGTVRRVKEHNYQLENVKVTGHNGDFDIHLKISRLPDKKPQIWRFGALVLGSAAPLNPEFFTISFGQILEIASVVGGLFWTVFRLGSTIQGVQSDTREMKSDISDLKTGMNKLDNVVTDMAVQGKRMDLIDIRMDDIVKGRIRIMEEPQRGRR
jgi:hypothetical protein